MMKMVCIVVYFLKNIVIKTSLRKIMDIYNGSS